MNRSWKHDGAHPARATLCGLLALGLGLAPTAHAQGYSTDLELVRPVFSHKGLPGIDTPVMAAQPTLRPRHFSQISPSRMSSPLAQSGR